MELCLGTVQFGMDYGIFNQPKKDLEYCVKCLDYATQNGIYAIDTAAAYGTAEIVTGSFLAKRTITRDKIFISTKLLPNILDNAKPHEYKKIILENLKRSLNRLHTDYVDAYLLHSSRYAFDEYILEALSVVQKEGLSKQAGVSVYEPEEAIACCKSPYVDYIQAPYSIFDHRMKEKGIFNEIARSSCSISTRTAFIKGLIHLNVKDVPSYLSKSIPILCELDEICSKTGYTRIELALGYVKREKTIKHIVFGIRGLEQLEEDINAFRKDIPEEIFLNIDKKFAGIEAGIVVPSLWKKQG